jgi:hypothetical protein
MQSLFVVRRARFAALALFTPLVWSAAPVHAGRVYAPVIASQVGDVQFTPQVVLESASEGIRSISESPAGADGIGGIGGSGGIGWLALETEPGLRISASAMGRAADGGEVVLPLPLLSPSQATPGGDTATLRGLHHGPGVHSHLYLASWAGAVNRCTIQVRDTLGTTVFGATTAQIAPQALTPFLDVLTKISEVDAAEARVDVSCSEPFSAFATVHRTGSDGEPLAETVVPTAPGYGRSHGGAESLASRAGAEAFAGACAGSVARHCYHHPGTFFAPAKKTGNQKRAIFPVSRGDYRGVRLRMDVLYGGPNPRNRSGLQQIFWMAINSRNVDLVGFTSVRKSNTALMQRAGIGTGPAAKSKVIHDVRLTIGQTYLMDYFYDAGARLILWNVVDRSSGRLVASILDTPNVRAVRFGSDGHMAVDVSMDGSNKAEPPSYGWVYSDLVYEIFQ